ncbi:unannotated protein [freshwater metagenome]|uniref:Unannotated protein n=1 Tax=freshwater metagenome TaxID=449393 RepID=A0A6J6W843_9ZZZZ
MTVPTGATGNVVALHRSVARKDVLKYARFDVVSTGHAVSGGGTFVKDPAWAVHCSFQASLKNAFALPQVEDAMFKGG